MGQYIPGDSLLHRLDPRTKLFLLVLFAIFLVTAESFTTHIAGTLYLIAATLCSRQFAKRVPRLISGLLIFFAMVVALHTLFTPSEHEISWWFFHISLKGLARGGLFSLRLILMVWAASLFGWSTPPVELADAVERALMPFRKLGVPVREIGAILLIGMRFVPTLFDDARRIHIAQKARGLRVEGSLLTRVHSLVPMVVPLFARAFHRADTIAVALDVKGFSTSTKRTFYCEMRLRSTDYWIIAASIAFFGIAFLLR